MIELEVGQECRINAHIDEAAVAAFITLCGDDAALHVDSRFAREAGFEDKVVHGALLAAHVSRLVGTQLPGRYSVLERIDLSFRQACYAPCDLEVVGKVRQISEAVASVVLDISVLGANDLLIATGKTWHRILDRKQFS